MAQITVQRIARKDPAPRVADLKKWAKTALDFQSAKGEITIRIVDIAEITALNTQYRQKPKSTNVLSFPFEALPESIRGELPLFLGDIVICAAIVNQEADAQGKSQNAHWAHILIHGILHLLGYDHETEAEAYIMETLEITLLESMNFSNPY